MGETSADLTRVVRRALAVHFSEEALRQWFDPLRLQKDLKEQELTIIWPHRLFAAWLTDDRLCALEEAVQHAEKGLRIHYANGPVLIPEATPATRTTPRPGQEETPEFPFGEPFTLDTFFSNTKNAFPMTVLREVAAGKLRWNPLVLYGTTSTGKSHLIRAMGNALSERYGSGTIFCGSADDFEALQAPLTDRELLARIGKMQAVLVDDVQRLQSLSRLRDVLPLVLDHCVENGKPFLCTTCLAPSQWDGLPERVGARLEQGLVMLLQEADMDIRLRFAQHHSRLKRLNLSREQLLALAQQCTSLRRMTGIIQRLSALRDLLDHDVSVQDIESVLAHTADNAAVTPQTIIRVVAARYGVRPDDLTSDKRQPKVARARQIAMFLCRSLLGASYPALGRLFGGRDHSTVIHSVKKIQGLWENDTDMHNFLSELSLSCRQNQK